MARLTLNVDQADFDSAGRSFTPVPPADYTVSIFSITSDVVKTGDNAGKPRLKFQFRIADGETSPDGQSQANRRLFADINAFDGINKKTGKPTPPFDLVAIGKALGLTPEELKDCDTDDWLGQELQVTVVWKRKQHQVNGSWVDIEPAEYRENVKGFRSLESVAESAAATAKVTGKANTGAKAGVAPKAAAGAAKKPLIKL